MDKVHVGLAWAIIALVSAIPAMGQQETQIAIGDETMDLTGPFNHGNLSIYIISQSLPPARLTGFLTLPDGLKKGLVAVRELGEERISQLEVSNDSDSPLFLQEGQLLVGGKQDRVLTNSVVVPAHSAKVMVSTLCAERSRWEGGRVFGTLGVIAPPNMRLAAAQGNQRQVWSTIRTDKLRLAREIARTNRLPLAVSRSSSLREQLQGDAYEMAISGFVRDLGTLPRVSNPLGVVFAINGRLVTADVYASSDLFVKLYPQLLKAAASQALAVGVAAVQPPEVGEVGTFISDAWEGRPSRSSPARGNLLMRIDTPDALGGQLFYLNQWIHLQVLSKGPRGLTVLPAAQLPLTPAQQARME